MKKKLLVVLSVLMLVCCALFGTTVLGSADTAIKTPGSLEVKQAYTASLEMMYYKNKVKGAVTVEFDLLPSVWNSKWGFGLLSDTPSNPYSSKVFYFENQTGTFYTPWATTYLGTPVSIENYNEGYVGSFKMFQKVRIKMDVNAEGDVTLYAKSIEDAASYAGVNAQQTEYVQLYDTIEGIYANEVAAEGGSNIGLCFGSCDGSVFYYGLTATDTVTTYKDDMTAEKLTDTYLLSDLVNGQYTAGNLVYTPAVLENETPAEPDPTPDPEPTTGIAITEETMLANPSKLLPVFNHGGVERLNVVNGQIASWVDGNFFYKDLVDSVSFPFSIAKDSKQTMLFIGLHMSGPGNVPWNSTGYYVFINGKEVGLYRIGASDLSAWDKALIGEKFNFSENIFDGGIHNVAFAVSGKTLTFTIGEETITRTFEADVIPVENTELAMSANSTGTYLIGEPLAVEQAYTGTYTNLEDLIKTGAIRPDYNYDSVANNYFCEVADGYVFSNGSTMSFSANLTAVDFDIVVTAGSSMFFSIRTLNTGNIWDMAGGYIAWVNGTSLRFYDASQRWSDSPVIMATVPNIYDGQKHNIKMYAFDDSKGYVQVGFAIDNGEFFTLIDTSNPTKQDVHTEFYMHDVNEPSVKYKVTATEGTTHAYGEPVVVAPTCTEGGYTVTTCADCKKAVVTDETAATGHSHTADVTAPGCLTGGYTTYTCTCGDSYVADEVAATGHSYNEVVTAPTCEDKGYTTHTCPGCGDSYEDTFVNAIGHNFVAGTVVAPTCTEAGHTVYECENCDASEIRDEVEAHGHNFVETSRTEASVGVAGEIVYDCENCDETKVEVIPALPEITGLCSGSIGVDLGLISVALGSVAMIFARKNKRD